MNNKGCRLRLVRLVLTALALLVLGAVVFRDFVFGDKVLLYKDIGDDSTNSYYPYLLLFSRYIRTDGIPMWSFNAGMGQNLFSGVGDLVFSPSIWFRPEAIAQLLVHQHLLHILVAGLLFYKFLTLRGMNFCASLLGALLFSFSAFMCMGSCWLLFGNEVICVAFLLFAIETALRRGHWLYLPFAVALFSLVSAFHVYLCGVLLGSYVLVRLIVTSGQNLGPHRPRIAQIAIIALLGLGLAAVVWLDSAQSICNSPRGSGINPYAGKLASFGIFRLEKPLHYFTAILRTFSNDMIGRGDKFRGWFNYLEAPASYVGLLPLLMLPQVFVPATKRQRITYSFLLALILLATVFPWFRYLFWLFQGDYYRTFSFFSVAAILILSASAFSRYVETATLNVWVLVGTLLALLAILFLPLPEMQKLMDPALKRLVVLFLVSYTIVLSVGKFLKRERLCGWLIVLMCAAELAYFSWMTVSLAPTVTKSELHQLVGYNDETKEAVRDIKMNEHGFYRISKLYSSSPTEHDGLNDAVVFDFYSTDSYHSFNNIDYITFLFATEVIAPNATEVKTRWTYVRGRPILATFLGEKYVLNNKPLSVGDEPGYEEVGHYKRVYVYRNTSFLPLGLFFSDAIPGKIFRRLSRVGKDVILLQSVVLEDSAAEFTNAPPPMLSRVETQPFASAVAARKESAFVLEKFSQNHIEGSIRCAATGFLVFQMPFDPGWRATVDDARVAPRRVDIGLLGLPLSAGEHKVKLRYLPPLFETGMAITASSFLLLVIARWRWPRLELLRA